MMKHQQAISHDRELRVRPPLVIAELNLEHALVEPLDHGPHLAPDKPMLGHVHEQGDDVENVDGSGGRHGWNLRGDSSWSIAGSLPSPHNPAGPIDPGPLRPDDY
jgi:hypothetical protein